MTLFDLGDLARLEAFGLLDPYLRNQLTRINVSTLAAEVGHVLQLFKLPGHHNDPFDRLLMKRWVVCSQRTLPAPANRGSVVSAQDDARNCKKQVRTVDCKTDKNTQTVGTWLAGRSFVFGTVRAQIEDGCTRLPRLGRLEYTEFLGLSWDSRLVPAQIASFPCRTLRSLGARCHESARLDRVPDRVRSYDRASDHLATLRGA